MMKTKKIAIAGMSAALAFGAGSGFLLSLPGSASASSAQVASVSTPTEPTADATDAAKPAKGERLTEALQPLVDAGTISAAQLTGIVDAVIAADDVADTAGTEHNPQSLIADTLSAQVSAGTLTQAQSDAVTTAIEAARPQGGGRGGDHGGRHGGRHGGQGRRGVSLEVAATTLGITSAELKTELEAGKTIADVATEKGVAVQTVIDALVGDATANITERITNFVNGVQPSAPSDAPVDTTAGANG